MPNPNTTDPSVVRPSSRSRKHALVQHMATWPPVVYAILGLFALLFWAGGTAIQVQTSEAWIMGVPLKDFPSIATFGQLWEFAWGRLPVTALVPFSFGWGVQVALIIASVGVELPRRPRWRFCLLLALRLLGSLRLYRGHPVCDLLCWTARHHVLHSHV